MAALTATLGHNFSPFLGFRGGKGAATVLGISAVMLWQLTAVAALGGLALLAISRHVILSMVGAFVLLNGLTIGTAQPLGMIVLCLVLSLIVGATHVFREYDQLLPAMRRRQWRRFMSVE